MRRAFIFLCVLAWALFAVRERGVAFPPWYGYAAETEQVTRSQALSLGVPAYRIARAMIEGEFIEVRDQITEYAEQTHVTQSGSTERIASQNGRLRIRRLPTNLVVFYDATGTALEITVARRRLSREATVVILAGGIPQDEYVRILRPDTIIVSVRSPDVVPIATASPSRKPRLLPGGCPVEPREDAERN